MSTKFQLERSKLNLDMVEKPENRSVHKLTDSNVSPGPGADRAPLESVTVSSCTRFSGFFVISSFGSSIKWLSLLVTKCTVFDDVISRRHDVIYDCHVTPRDHVG